MGRQQRVPEPQCYGCSINRRLMEMYRVLVYTVSWSLLFNPPSIMIRNLYTAACMYTHPSGTQSGRVKAGNQLSFIWNNLKLSVKKKKNKSRNEYFKSPPAFVCWWESFQHHLRINWKFSIKGCKVMKKVWLEISALFFSSIHSWSVLALVGHSLKIMHQLATYETQAWALKWRKSYWLNTIPIKHLKRSHTFTAMYFPMAQSPSCSC